MKNLFRYFVVIALFALILIGTTEANAQTEVRELYKRMDANLQTLTSLKTGIRMEKYNSQIKDVDDARQGVAMFIPNKKDKSVNFRLDWQGRVQESLSVIEGEYKLFQPRLGQVIIGKNKDVQTNDKAGGIFKLINMSAKDLKTNFDAKWLGQEIVANVYSTYKLQLTPKTAMSFNSAEIWVNENGMILQIKVYEKNNDWTNILLIDPVKNAKISKGDLALKYPRDTKIIKG